MKKAIFIFIVLCLYLQNGIAQNTVGILEGRIWDSATNEPIVGANVVILDIYVGDASDTSGYFKIDKIPFGSHEVAVIMIGYKTFREKIEIKSEERQTLVIKLFPTALKGKEIIVEGERVNDIRLEITPPTFKLQSRQIEIAPGALDDVFSTLQTLPGVLPLSDYSNQYIVRSGSPDQNLILLDGVELFNPYRRSGMASLVNPAIVEGVQLYTGGFPALFGDRLSSVLAVTTREGTTTKWLSGKINANVSNASIALEGKTNFWNGGWLVSGRRSYFDLFSESFAQDLGIANEIAFPEFEDLQGKLVLRPASGHRLQFTGLYNRNIMDLAFKKDLGEQDSEKDSLNNDDQLENTILGASWNYSPSDRFQSKIYANWYKNNGNSNFSTDFLPVDEEDRSGGGGFFGPPPLPPTFSTVDTLSFAHGQLYDFRKQSFGGWIIYQGNRHVFESGMGLDYLENTLTSSLELNDFGKVVFDALVGAPLWFGALTDSIDLKESYSRGHFYVQDKWSLFEDRVFIQPGIRYDYFEVIDKNYITPRLNLTFDINLLTKLQAAWGIYRQSPGYDKLLDKRQLNGTQSLDLLRFRSLDGLLAEKGTHNLVNLTRKLSDTWELSIAGYTKELEQLITQGYEQTDRLIARYLSGAPGKTSSYIVEESTVLQQSPNPVNDARVSAHGFDFRLEKQAVNLSDRLSGWISYAYGKAIQEQTLNNKRITFPFDYDRRHALNLAFNYRIWSYLNLGVTWKYGTGFPYTPALSSEPLIAQAPSDVDSTIIRGFFLTDPESGDIRFVPTFGGPENLNSRRLPDYHRLDIRISYSAKLLGTSLEFYLDMINVYNRKNVLYFQNLIRIEGGNENLPPSLRFSKPVLYHRPVYMFPFIPSLGFSLSF